MAEWYVVSLFWGDFFFMGKVESPFLVCSSSLYFSYYCHLSHMRVFKIVGSANILCNI
jgi:hypothetical protein